MLDSFKIFYNIFSKKVKFIYLRYRQHDYFIVFKTIFPIMPIWYILEMSSINIIDYKIKDFTITFFFIPAMFSKVSTIKNISIFENWII